MNKKYIIALLLINAALPAHALQLLRSMTRTFSRVQQAAAMHLKAYRAHLRIGKSWTPQAGLGKGMRAQVLIPASTLGAATYLDYHKRPTPSLWALRAQGNEVPRTEMIATFIKDCAHYQPHNTSIPKHVKNEDSVRIATYNVHNWRDPYGAPNFDAIMATIKDVNADVFILQECSLFDKRRIEQALTKCGYDKIIFSATIKGKKQTGNMIISKYPVEQTITKTYQADQQGTFERRNFIKTKLTLPHNKSITLFGTHLDVWDATEKKRAREITELAERATALEGNVLIGADFNAVRKRDYDYTAQGNNVWNLLNDAHHKRTKLPVPTHALEHLEQQQFTDSFALAHMQSPRFTVWSGTTVDFMYLNKQWNLPVKGSYVYYSAASDHLPVIVDLGLKPT